MRRAITRQLTGTPTVHRGYVLDTETGRIVCACSHAHRGHRFALRCAERMMRRMPHDGDRNPPGVRAKEDEMNAKPKIARMHATIEEKQDHWILRWDDAGLDDGVFPTAAEALAKVKKFARTLADDQDISSVITVTWWLTTRAGRMIQSALQD